MSTVLEVKNMHCQSCSKRIVTAVQSIQPGAQVTVEIEAGRVTVQPPIADIVAVISAIAKAGYEARAAA